MALDERSRQARWAADKPLVLLPRFLDWPELSLGLTREQASKALPPELKKRSPIKTVDGGFSILFTRVAPATATYFPLQLVLRFGADDKLDEVRIRYQEGLAKPTAATPSLLDVLNKANGAPEPVPASWLGLWRDLPVSKVGPTCLRWRDDRSMVTYQVDSCCSEVILTDCPRDHAFGVPLPKLEACGRGPDGCRLGESREELVKRWKLEKAKLTADGGLVVFQPTTSPYDLAVVYFEGGKANRVLVAIVRRPAASTEDFTTDLNRTWIGRSRSAGRSAVWIGRLHSDTRSGQFKAITGTMIEPASHSFAEQTKDGWRPVHRLARSGLLCRRQRWRPNRE